jgi:predicted dehydrogenase
VLNDKEVDAVLITTRHNQHASMTIESLKAGKHVFVEKPLAITQQQLDEIISAFSLLPRGRKEEGVDVSRLPADWRGLTSNFSITVGFNRRFSPFAKKTKQLLGAADTPINVIATMNAGHIPPEVWVHDMLVGGGRIIGEACHFVDLITYFTGSKVKSVHMSSMGSNPSENTDNAVITLKYENGSQGVINYFANGSKSYSKERIEVYWSNKTIVIDNFREMKGYGIKGFSKMKSKQDKGHYNQFKEFLEFLKNGDNPPIPFDEIINTTQATLSAIESLKTNQVIKL